LTQPPPALSCNRDLLVRSLEDALPERDEEQLVEYLSSCVSCQRELERLAAEKSEWTRVGTTLREESSGGAESRLPPTELRREEAAPEALHEDTLADFSVDFLAPALNEEALGRLDGIDILEVIGRGGMGVVLKGFEEELNRPVVVKMLAPHLAGSGAEKICAGGAGRGRDRSSERHADPDGQFERPAPVPGHGVRVAAAAHRS